MYATEHRAHGDPTQPYVSMTPEEADRLGATLQALCAHLTGRINWTLAQRLLAQAARDRQVAELRAQLATLAEFYAAHCEAHDLRVED